MLITKGATIIPSGGAKEVFSGIGSPVGVVTASGPAVYLDVTNPATPGLWTKGTNATNNTDWVLSAVGSPAGYGEVSLAALGSRAVVPGIRFPLSSSRATGRLVVGSVVDENPGAGPLTLWWRGRLPSSFATSAGICGLGPDSTYLLGGSGAVAFALAIIGSDVQLIMGNSTTRTQYALSMAGLAGQVADIVVTRSGLTLAAYVNGVAVTLTPVNTGAGFTADATINGDFYHAGAPLSATISGANNVVAGPHQRFTLFNRSLSASEASSLILNGVDPEDQWGTKVEAVNATTLNGGFETPGAGGADVFANWSETTSGTTTINRDTSVFASGTASLRFDIDGSSSVAAVFQNMLEVGKRYRVTTTFRHNAASSVSPQIVFDTIALSFGSVAPNTWVTQSTEAVANGGYLFVYRRAGFPSTSHWYDNVIVQRIGAIVDLQFDGTCGFMAADRANQRDAVLFNGAAFTLPDATRGFARWVASVPAGERMGGSAAIVIPTDASVSRIIAHNLNVGSGQTISIGSGSGANLSNMAANVPLNGTGQITVIDLATSTSATGQLWISYTGTGSIQVTAIFERF